jgi:hypothetical protein
VSSPASPTAGTTFSTTVTAFDQFNNTKTDYVGTVHFTSTDAGPTVTLQDAYGNTPNNTTVTVGLGLTGAGSVFSFSSSKRSAVDCERVVRSRRERH